ncbi:DUF6311 domain-containing protein [Myxococcus hansupus]|uniref:DUF6311 domain-containing protein n=1 Tax=Pseudomyxococcus hansupus TaxID=1297742 RepID=UPI001D03C6F2|nr:DUF6311 domain-containing protein [Myxococcus hansupus]
MTTEPGDKGERLLPWVGAVVGVLWFLVAGGAPTLDPTNLDGLGIGDPAQHVLGWLHFRDAPWSFPLGRTPSLMAPHVMTVGFSDSNPWLSLLLKPFARWLPRDFQFIGPWLALCFALQGAMAVKLMGLFTRKPLQRVLGAAFFVTAPVLLARVGHDTLCAHWMLTAMLWLYLRPREAAAAARRSLRWALLLNVLAAGTHPYLTVMVFALSVALLVQAWREGHLSSRAAGGVFAGLGLAVSVPFLAFGYVGQGVSTGTIGFGIFSADLLTFINPLGSSRLLPSLPVNSGQYEGFGYLGTGALALGVAGLFGWVFSDRPRSWERVKPLLPLVLVALALTVLGFSSTMTVAGRTVLTMRKLMEPVMPMLGAFRASGRFIWPLYYLLLTGGVAWVLWRWRQRPGVATALLLGAVLLQVVDAPDAWSQRMFVGAPWPRLQAPEWERVDAAYRQVTLVPPVILGSQRPCVENGFPEHTYVRFGDLAYRRGLTTNSGYSARLNEPRVAEVCAALMDDVEHGRLAEDTVYVVDAAKRPLFERLGDRVTCGALDGYTVCVAARDGAFRESLKQASPPPPAPAPSANTPL